MRGFLASSIGVTCAAALALPLTLPTASHAAPSPTREAVPGSTQSLALDPLETSPGSTSTRAAGAPQEQGLTRRDVRPFSLVGVVWDDPDAQLHGNVQVRTRTTNTTRWSTWQDVETHNDDAPDLDTPERAAGGLHGATAPLWVGDSDGVEVRVKAEEPEAERAARPATLPKGLRLELVDPGEEPPQGSRAEGADTGVIPALDKKQTEDELIQARGGKSAAAGSRPFIGPRPRIITRKGWGANEKLRERKLGYTKTVKAAFIHHSASGNNYRCSQAPSVIRSIYRYHVKSSGWRDIGYNFLVDKCGNIYEGRAGGVAKPVMGAHTLGFNTNSTGIAVLGTFGSSKPRAAAVKAIARLTAWKLGLYGANPRGSTYLKSGGSNLYRKGKNVRLKVISGHRDGFATECPGRRLYNKLGSARSSSAHLQGR
ncbi:peptidoglycan recognition protein family protein [Streptomyces endophyticus]|uniref:Peptidoglycan recognition protein n=1 Tax=Streptomyces endophyticus TaxID=714166 RepID=A0ABU6FH07_9ACTN|nr:peptidoglycan recognition protein [Streptomyces endophyticus]MEB8343233.1 peptidoglycan recognition protein [Streptomyces endophyticus]